MSVDVKQLILKTMLLAKDRRVTTKELSEQVNPSIPQRSLQYHLDLFEDAGIIVKIRRGQYELTQKRKTNEEKTDQETPRLLEEETKNRNLSFAKDAPGVVPSTATLEGHILRYKNHDIMFYESQLNK
jgi:DNA-binding transcriptional ArsR family regulator